MSLEDYLKKEIGLSKNKIKNFVKAVHREKRVNHKDEVQISIDLINNDLVNPIINFQNPEVIYEDEYFIVLNKPYDSHCHALNYSETDNCLSALRSLGKGKHLYGFYGKEKGFLYRLDYATSGVLIYVKDPKNHKILRDNFSESVTQKSYMAKVEGRFDKEGSHTNFLKPYGEKGSRIVITNDEDTKASIATASFKLDQYDEEQNQSLVRVDLKTGHRHQIRVQLAALGFPIIGDKLYQGADAYRLMLQAIEYKLEFNEKEYLFATSTDLNH